MGDDAADRPSPRGLSAGLDRWQAPRAARDPGKVIADLAAAVALGGGCLAAITVPRGQPELAGPVASDPVVNLVAGSREDTEALLDVTKPGGARVSHLSPAVSSPSATRP